jgi:hypothetical protein
MTHRVQMPDGALLEFPDKGNINLRNEVEKATGIPATYLELFSTSDPGTSCCIVHAALQVGDRCFNVQTGLAIVVFVDHESKRFTVQHGDQHPHALRARITASTRLRRLSGRRAIAWRSNYDELDLQPGMMVRQDYANAANRMYIVAASGHPPQYNVAQLGPLLADAAAPVTHFRSRDLLMHAFPFAGTYEPSTHLRHTDVIY